MKNLKFYKAMMARIKSQFPVIKGKKRYEVKNINDKNEILIYDEIGWFGVTAEQFRSDLNALSGDIDVRINSPGGDVFDGMAMYNSLKQYNKGKVTVYIDGLAASAAGFIAMAGDEIKAPETAKMMHHEAWGGMVGNKRDMEKFSEILGGIDNQIASILLPKNKKSEPEFMEAFKNELWLTGKEAFEWGFVDTLIDYKEDDEADTPLFDLSVFNNVPEALKCSSDSETEPDTEKVPTRKDVEKALRNVGYSHKEAKAMYAAGKKALNQDDTEHEEIETPEEKQNGMSDLEKQRIRMKARRTKMTIKDMI